MAPGRRITDNLDALLEVLPRELKQRLLEIDRSDDLLEVILDLGRVPTARFVDREVPLQEQETLTEDIDYVVSRIGEFDADNRAGMERTLHRISAIRNRHDRHHPGPDRERQVGVAGRTSGSRQDHHAARGRPHPG